MSDIPTEIYIEILRRVPVESLFRFRSVCMSWRNIIDDPSFSKKHIHRGIGENWLFRRHDKGKLFLLPINELISSNSRVHWANATNVTILVGLGVPRMPKLPVPSCNGLILLSSCKTNLLWRIWNPFTGESLELGKCDRSANLAKLDVPCSGIGYDEANDDYKVVRIGRRLLDTFIYSVNLKEWRRVGKFPSSDVSQPNGVFAYGVLHWIVYSTERDSYGGYIAALDLSTENYRKIALPSTVEDDDILDYLRLEGMDGCLFLSSHTSVWMIKDYGFGDTWTEIISMNVINLITPLAYLKSKELVLLYQWSKQRYFWYDVEKKCMERFVIDVNANGFEEELDANEHINATTQVFTASLIRLKRSGVSDESVSSERTSNKKRKRDVAIERLPLKISFGDPGAMTGSAFSD